MALAGNDEVAGNRSIPRDNCSRTLLRLWLLLLLGLLQLNAVQQPAIVHKRRRLERRNRHGFAAFPIGIFGSFFDADGVDVSDVSPLLTSVTFTTPDSWRHVMLYELCEFYVGWSAFLTLFHSLIFMIISRYIDCFGSHAALRGVCVF
jgi:hypothetical protein